MAEYTQLRLEQTERIASRDTFVNLTLVAVGALIAFGLDQSRPISLLAIPWISLCFGYTFLVNDLKISRLGRYLDTIPDRFGVTLSWDKWRRTIKPTFLEKPVVGCAIQHVIFVVPAAGGSAAYLALRESGPVKLWESFFIGFGWISTLLISIAIVLTTIDRLGATRSSKTRMGPVGGQ